jgi:hypothetical protein
MIRRSVFESCCWRSATPLPSVGAHLSPLARIQSREASRFGLCLSRWQSSPQSSHSSSPGVRAMKTARPRPERRRPDSPRSRRPRTWRGQPRSSRRPATDGHRCSRRTTCGPVSTCTRRRGWGPTSMGNNQRPRSQRRGGSLGDGARGFPLEGAAGLTTARRLGSRSPLQMPRSRASWLRAIRRGRSSRTESWLSSSDWLRPSCRSG